MPSLFSRLKARDGKSKKKDAAQALADSLASQPKWADAYARTTVEPEEIHELVHCCTEELKTQALDTPFLLLPFRPTSDPSAVRTFIRHYFSQTHPPQGEALLQELRMTAPMVITGVLKWCWSRLQGGVVGWDAYELFKVGEHDSNMARDSFKTFIPISIENGARQRIIFDFFDLISAVAAHGKLNGFSGHKLSRMAAWWAFEQKDTSGGFEGGYNAWMKAADATSHLFFAYLRSLCPEQKLTGITLLPKSLETLLRGTAYPPPRRTQFMSSTNKVVMIVDAVSPTPFALLRRAKHFQYRDSDRALQEFSEFDDPIRALTEECRRVLKAISGANQSQVSSVKHSTGLRDASWSRFEDIGFSSTLDDEEEDEDSALARRQPRVHGLRTTPMSGNGLARPTTPSWADFLSTGFVDDNPNRLLLPPDKVLPPIQTEIRQHSSQSHRGRLESNEILEPGELASISLFNLDDAFWWVWISSLAPEETPERKSVFGRCAVVETDIPGGQWLVMEEMIAGAGPEPQEGAYLAEKKGFFSWTKRSKTVKTRKNKQGLDGGDKNMSKASIGPDTQAKVQAKAAQLRAKENQDRQLAAQQGQRRGRTDTELMAEKTNSVLTLQPTIIGEASSAMKWVKSYDKATIKEAYMANSSAGRGVPFSPVPSEPTNGSAIFNGDANGHQAPEPPFKEMPVSPVSARSPEPVSPAPPAPIERKEVASPVDDQPQDIEAPASPLPPPKDNPTSDVDRENALSPEPVFPTPEARKQQKKLHKANKEKAGGFRKLFGRKKGTAKSPNTPEPPEDGGMDLNEFLRQQQRPSGDAGAPVPAPPTKENAGSEGRRTPIASSPVDAPLKTPDTPREVATEPPFEPSEPSRNGSLSRVNTNEAAEADQEFARFDQGPLADQPAFAPDDSDDDAVPPPVQRAPVTPNRKPVEPTPEEKLNQGAGPGVQDRWAQIRKNAAERAAHRQVDDYKQLGASKQPVDGDDDTSGEETIESRVARIKARVAELTGNMEGTTPPQSIAGRR